MKNKRRIKNYSKGFYLCHFDVAIYCREKRIKYLLSGGWGENQALSYGRIRFEKTIRYPNGEASGLLGIRV